MEQIQLGGSDIRVSRLCVGTWSFGGEAGSYWGEQDQGQVDALVAEALDRGVNFFDTAFGYNNGNSEISLGKALKGRREKAVICNKIPIQDMEGLKNYEAILQDSLKRLDTSYIDLMMIHWPVKDEALLRANLEALLDARRKGIIREIGVSNFGLGTLAIAGETGVNVAADEFAYNLLTRGIEKEVLPYCRRNHIGVLAYMPLMQGVLSGKYGSVAEIPLMRRRTIHYSKSGNPNSNHGTAGADAEVETFLAGLRNLSEKTGLSCGRLSIAWLCDREGVASVIAGCRSPEQLRENGEAVETMLSAETARALDDLSAPLLDKLGNFLDMWNAPENSRIW
jgi:aryl-alcohol dehydrogenase-like predicted oxidoreductase